MPARLNFLTGSPARLGCFAEAPRNVAGRPGAAPLTRHGPLRQEALLRQRRSLFYCLPKPAVEILQVTWIEFVLDEGEGRTGASTCRNWRDAAGASGVPALLMPRLS